MEAELLTFDPRIGQPWGRQCMTGDFVVDGITYRQLEGGVHPRTIISLEHDTPFMGSTSYMRCSDPPTDAELDAWVHDPYAGEAFPLMSTVRRVD